MLDLNSRQKDLIRTMLNENEYRTMGEYSGKLNISSRTLYTDIEKINQIIKSLNMYIEKKPRIGIRLVGETEDKIEMMKLLNNNIIEGKQYSTFERQCEIMKMLFIEEKVISYQMLSEKFIVSKTSIFNDIETITNMLNEKTVSIISDKKGTRILGDEIQKQYTLKLFTEKILKENKILNEKDFLKYGPVILGNIYPSSIVDIVFNEIKKFENELNIFLAFPYLKSLTSILMSMTFRLSRGCHIGVEKKLIFEEIKSLETYFISQSILKNISQKIDISIKDSDIDYLNKQLIAHGIKFEVKMNDETNLYEDLVRDSIAEMSRIMNVELRYDKKLYEGLMMHIVPMFYRLKMGIKIINPLLNEIKNQYSVTLNATWYIMAKMAGKMNISLTEDEVAFIMVHFQAAIDRNEEVKKILIVCPTGIGSSELIANKIKRFLPAKDIIEVASIRQIYESNIKNIDLIISSVKLDIKDKPIIYVSSLVSNEDLRNISKIYADIFIDNRAINYTEPNHMKFSHISNMLFKELIFTEEEFQSKEECLNHIITSLEDNGFTNEGFRKSILDRELLGATSLDSGVAIPHALPETVKKSCISIMTMKNHIRWSGKSVNTVILIAISKNDIKHVKNILSEVYAIVESKEVVQNIFENKGIEEVYSTLGGQEND